MMKGNQAMAHTLNFDSDNLYNLKHHKNFWETDEPQYLIEQAFVEMQGLCF